MAGHVKESMNRGSEWYRWDPHIHAPGTVLEDKYPKEDGWERYLDSLETVSPPLRAIGITDYYITRSYERMKEEKAHGRAFKVPPPSAKLGSWSTKTDSRVARRLLSTLELPARGL